MCARFILLVVILGVLLLGRLLTEEDPTEAAYQVCHASDEDMPAVIDAATLAKKYVRIGEVFSKDISEEQHPSCLVIALPEHHTLARALQEKEK